MIEGEAIAALRASPLHRGTTKIVVVVIVVVVVVVWVTLTLSYLNSKLLTPALAGLAIWPRLDNANTLGNTEVNFGPDDA